LNYEVEPRVFYEPETILKDVQDGIKKAGEAREKIDYLTFVPDGEPTLDENLGRTIDLLKPLGIKIAIITNGSLIWRKEVRERLLKSDWVSFKVDSMIEELWRKTDRPYKSLHFDDIFSGMLQFKKAYRGELTTETMLVRDVNDGGKSSLEVARFLGKLKPAKAYISIPTRPPAESSVKSPVESRINSVYQVFSRYIDDVEYLIGYEGNAFAFTGNPETDLMSITAVHPMRQEAVEEFIRKSGADWSLVQRLLDQGHLIETYFEGQKFYMRRFGRRIE
jgi:wyosine [tRNA(Phe)-imidazoG37] synthetase (radical SAM superfamily)